MVVALPSLCKQLHKGTLSSFLHSLDSLIVPAPRRAHASPRCHVAPAAMPAPKEWRGAQEPCASQAFRFLCQHKIILAWWFCGAPFLKHLFTTHRPIYTGVPRMFCAGRWFLQPSGVEPLHGISATINSNSNKSCGLLIKNTKPSDELVKAQGYSHHRAFVS